MNEPFRKCTPAENAFLNATRTRLYEVTLEQNGEGVSPGSEVATISIRAESPEQAKAMLALRALCYKLTHFRILEIKVAATGSTSFIEN